MFIYTYVLIYTQKRYKWHLKWLKPSFFQINIELIGFLGIPAKLRDDILPTKLDIYQHFLYLSREKCLAGEWQRNTDISVKVKAVRDDVADIWDRTGISHGLGDRKGEQRICNLISSCKATFKVPLARRQAGFARELQVLFDVALCQHSELHTCTCDSQDQIIPVWKAFLTDQRGPRVLQGVLSMKSLSLRAAGDSSYRSSRTWPGTS